LCGVEEAMGRIDHVSKGQEFVVDHHYSYSILQEAYLLSFGKTWASTILFVA
jgi:hypothetical protein